jgi:methylthioribose-1-phosphate isomerase
MSVSPLVWDEGSLRLLDQTRLPHDELWLTLEDHRSVAEAIRSMRVRGAPAIGIAAAYGLALAAIESTADHADDLIADLERAAKVLEATRPTAVNLAWAIRRVLSASRQASAVDAMREAALRESILIHDEDISANRRLGAYGAELLPPDATLLTHCNAGALATGGYGTALGIARAAADAGSRVRVIATETRPLLQGARITAWELERDGIDCTLIVDSAAAALLRRGTIDAVVVGADRVAANGDVANKIGTYPIALAAREHAVPFYVAAPCSSIDLSTPSGRSIPIEDRAEEEVQALAGRRTVPQSVRALNPAFDITPHALVSAIVTERGVARPAYAESLANRLMPVGATA